MASHAHDRRFELAAVLLSLAVVLPLLGIEQDPAREDVITARAGATLEAKLARNVAGLCYDDGFYYLQIARHLASGAGSTFDGLHPTNGYHPLWLWILVPLAWLLAPDRLLLASFAVQVLAAAATAVLVFRLARRFAPPLAAFLAVAVWIRVQCTYWMSWAGMEYGLQALSVVALCYLAVLANRGDGPPSPRRVAALGVLASLAALARLDNLLLAALVGLAFAWRWRGRGGWRLLAIYLAPVVLTFTLYTGLNRAYFGHPSPVSGEVKSAWSREALARDPLYLSHGWWSAKAAYLAQPLSHPSRSYGVSLFFGALGGLGWVVGRAAGRWWATIDWTPLAVFAALQYLAYALVFHGGFSYQPWYFVAQPLSVALATAALARWAQGALEEAGMATPPRRWGMVAVTCLVLASIALNVARRGDRLRGFGSEPLYAAAGWSRAHLPEDAVVGAWNSGMLAFFGDRTVVNLDGLVNSRDYFLRHRHDLCAYFESVGIGYLVDVFDDQEPFAQHGAAFAGCQETLERIWAGPGYDGSPRRAIAFQRVAGSGTELAEAVP